MGLAPPESPLSGMRRLVGCTEQLREEISRLTMSYNINIIVGGMPLYEEGIWYNVAYRCRHDGTIAIRSARSIPCPMSSVHG